MKKVLAVFLLLLFCVLFSNLSFAHKVNVFVFVEGKQVFVEGYFTDGKKPKSAKVTVEDSSKSVVVEGETDGDGGFVFDIPKRDDLLITLYAGQGHKAQYLLPKADLEGVVEVSTEKTSTQINSAASLEVAGSAGAGISAAELEAAVQSAVSKAIRPLARSLHEAQEKASFSDLIGGIGFIVGLFGVYMYFQSRKTVKG